MAKNISPIFKLQGTIDDLTFVNSKRYKPHVRARKNSKTPFVMTTSLAESKARLQQCNQYAKPVYQGLRAELHDGGLWSRLVSQLFAELKAGRPLGLECLQGFECNLQHKLGEVINKGYDLSATQSQNQLGIYVQLNGHPKVEDGMPRTGYQLRFVAIIPDAESGTVKKVEMLGPLTKYKDELMAHDLKMELPGNGAPYIVLMGIVPHMQGEGAVRIMSDSGMRVVWVGKQASSGELRAASEIQEGMAEEAASEVVERQAMSGAQSEVGREETFANGVVELVGLGAKRVAGGGPAMSGEIPARRNKLRTRSGKQEGMTSKQASENGTAEVVALAVDAAAAGERQVLSGELSPGRDKLRATRGRQDTYAACSSHALAPAKDAWEGGAPMVSGSTKKGPKPLLIDAAGDWGKGLAAGADHEDAALVLHFKSRLAGSANNEDDALLNTHHSASSGSHEIILHNKTFN